jgi:hypothetical protein
VKYTLETALDQLARCGLRRIDVTVIPVSKSDPPGLRAWGAIDFLCKHCGYSIERV